MVTLVVVLRWWNFHGCFDVSGCGFRVLVVLVIWLWFNICVALVWVCGRAYCFWFLVRWVSCCWLFWWCLIVGRVGVWFWRLGSRFGIGVDGCSGFGLLCCLNGGRGVSLTSILEWFLWWLCGWVWDGCGFAYDVVAALCGFLPGSGYVGCYNIVCCWCTLALGLGGDYYGVAFTGFGQCCLAVVVWAGCVLRAFLGLFGLVAGFCWPVV